MKNEDHGCSCNLMQCLLDMGCSPELTREFIEYQHTGNKAGQLKVLTKHRRNLLDSLHAEQEKLDCLDYIIFKIKKDDSL